jgi:predicted pyridoxine 5'-phosphate oxidase superfamily flavin-nucleotide-binding protein
LAFPDLAGNNRLDSIGNLVDSPGVGLLFMIPGLDETLRVNGTATITSDPAILELCVDGDLVPNVAIGVDVEAAYIHCAKALRRSRLWHPEAWPALADMTSIACMLRDHYNEPDLDVGAVEDHLEVSYEQTTWAVGGTGL